MTPKRLKHRLARGRLWPIHRGVYAVGRPEVRREGRWMAAVLACGDAAVLSHGDALELWDIMPGGPKPRSKGRLRAPLIDITIPGHRRVRRDGIRIHRRSALPVTPDSRNEGIPVTSPIQTLVDIAAGWRTPRLEAAIVEVDKRGLATPSRLLAALQAAEPRQPGVARLRDLLARQTFTLTDSHLERLFLPIAQRAGLPPPRTQVTVNGYRVDFFWPELGLVVETDGLRYHRTPTQQARDRIRDQAHTAAGLTPLRFTHAQVAHDAEHVERVLEAWGQRARRAGRATGGRAEPPRGRPLG